MKKKTLFLNVPLILEQNFSDYPFFANLGILHNAAVLLRKGWNVKIVDSFALPQSRKIPFENGWILGTEYDEFLSHLPDEEFDKIVIGNNPFLRLESPCTHFTVALSKIRKKYKTSRLILADCDFSGMHHIAHDRVLRKNPEIDQIIKYECEEVFPAFDLIDIKNFRNFLHNCFSDGLSPNTFRIDMHTLPLYTCRRKRIKGKNLYQTYSIEYLKNWIYLLSKGFGAKKLIVLDDAANVRSDFVEMINFLNEMRLNYEFPKSLVPELLSDEILKKMKNHVSLLSVSAETEDKEFPDAEKNAKRASISRVASMCSKENIPLVVHFIIGFPWENLKDVENKLEFAYSLFESYKIMPSIRFPAQIKGFETGFLEKVRDVFQIKCNAAKTKKLIINITYNCNNACRFCAVGNRIKADIPVEKVREYLRNYREKGYDNIDFDGGEPTVHNNLIDVIGFAKTLGYTQINVSTNGRKLSDPSFADALVKSGITSLLISFHGHKKEIHEAATTVEGSYNQTLQGIRNVLAVKQPDLDFGINTTISVMNVDYLEDLAEFLSGLSVKKLNLQCLTPFGRAQTEIVPPVYLVAARIKQVVDRFRDRMRIYIINAQLCMYKGYENFVMSDIWKLGRTMIFVTEEEVNLFDYLGARRTKNEQCDGCVYSQICDGFNDFSMEEKQ
jgi:MoaA/NifB/PqqE/SkfB family radical SAM enzyme